MAIGFKHADLSDLEALVSSRIKVLIAANRLSEDTDMSVIEQQSREYYRQSLTDGSHTAYLAFDGDAFVGAGGVSYYQVMPTYYNPSGWKAYIMNMYVRPAYRREGIATHILDLLVKDARARGIGCVTLEATDAGRPLYQKYGFIPMKHEMELP